MGPITIYKLLEKYDTKKLNYLVVGPWNHGGWSGASGKTLGPIDFGATTAPDYRRKHSGAVVRVLAQGYRQAGSSRGHDVRSRLEHVAKVGQLACACRRVAEAICTSTQTTSSHFLRRRSRGPRRPTRMSPIPRIQSRIARGPSSRAWAAPARRGHDGWSTISVFSRIERTSSVGKRLRCPTTSSSPAT